MYGKLVVQFIVSTPEGRGRRVTALTRYGLHESEAREMASAFIRANFHPEQFADVDAHWIPSPVPLFPI
jgi:hypothetical protein